jgi:hypothetical protein
MANERATAGARTAALASRPLSETLATVELPSDEYVGVARLVTSGVASRFELGYEDVDDLQLATETLLRVVFGSGGAVTLAIESDKSALYVVVSPADPNLLGRRLLDGYEPLELRAVLEQLVDGVAERADPDRAIELRVDLPTR